jgi:hypothetical protein
VIHVLFILPFLLKGGWAICPRPLAIIPDLPSWGPGSQLYRQFSPSGAFVRPPPIFRNIAGFP